MNGAILLWLILLFPAAAGVLAVWMPSPRACFRILGAGIFFSMASGCAALYRAFQGEVLYAASRWLFLDALSAFHLAVLILIFGLSTVYAHVYFREEIRTGHLALKQARLFSSLWCGAATAMSFVLLSNNLGMMWVGMETTTLVTAFLICVHVARESLEAMWKYILICSVGVAFAFMGTLLCAAAMGGKSGLLWTELNGHAERLDPFLMKAAFIFLLVGYGTKAGLAPMHNWLPDAHSQAPAPVSALFSGFMLSTALYCVMRYLPIVESATGNTGWSLRLLSGFGLLSILIAAAFILFQRNVKRFLAYSSMEHLGIIALGLGLGGFGVFAALFHTLNHALGKSLAFFSAGRLGQITGSHDMRKMSGALKISPLWGTALFGAILALIGMAPFAIFMSKFQIVKAAIDAGSPWILVLFFLGVGTVFVGALRHLLPLMWGKPESGAVHSSPSWTETMLALVPLILLLALGIWMPDFLGTILMKASMVVQPAVKNLVSGEAAP